MIWQKNIFLLNVKLTLSYGAKEKIIGKKCYQPSDNSPSEIIFSVEAWNLREDLMNIKD